MPSKKKPVEPRFLPAEAGAAKTDHAHDTDEPLPDVTVGKGLSEEQQKKKLFKLMFSAEANTREKAEEYGVTMADLAWIVQAGLEKGWPKK